MLLILQLDDFERIIFSFEPSLVLAMEWSQQHMDLETFVCAEIFVVLENAQHNIWFASTQLVCPLSDVSNYGE